MSILRNYRINSNLKVGSYSFEKVTLFKYLEVNLNYKNNIKKEIQERIINTNKCYYSLLKLLRAIIEKIENNLIYHLRHMNMKLRQP